MTPARDSSRTVIMRTWFCTWERPEMMRPVWPPEMPKTYSIPASAKTRATKTRAGISSVSMRSIAIASSSRQPDLRSVRQSLPRRRRELNGAGCDRIGRAGARAGFPENSARSALEKARLERDLPVGSSRKDRAEDVEFRGSALSLGGVQGHRGANESLQCLLVDRIALVEIDGAPCVPLETSIEEPRRVPQSRPFGEGHLDDVLVSLAGADQPGVRPHRNPSPLPLLDNPGIGFLDHGTQPAEHLASPVVQFLDSGVYQLRGRLAFLRRALLHAGLSSLVPRL